jgi:hypothetical protein
MHPLPAHCLIALLLSTAAAQSWVVHDPRPILPTITYDEHRGRGVMLQFSGTQLQVHEWDGQRWTPRWLGGPGPTSGSLTTRSLAFDPVRRHVVMLSSGQQQAWAWNGANWASLPAPPFVPQWWSMAFDDAAQGFVVLENTAILGQNRTWRFDGTTWSLIAANAPLPDLVTMMAHDRARQRTVLRSGNTTLEWNGTTWTGGVTTVVPPSNLRVLYEPQRGKVILPAATGTQWEWSGSDWVPFAAPATLVGQSQARPVFFHDERRQELVFCDDWTGTTQALTPTGWQLRQRLPGVGGALQLTADHSHGHMVAVETPAILNPNPPPSTLRWTPAGWHDLGYLGLPVRLGAAQADRDLLGVVYRFGGTPGTSATETDELWAFDGTAWTLSSAPNAPAPRRGGGLAVDPVRQRLVWFGGRQGTTYWNDTREFDGAQWIPKFPPNPPSPRSGHTMCGSAALGRVFLFGGSTAPAGAQPNDFWCYDGTDWTQLPSPPIGAVSWIALADFPAAGGVVLTAGAVNGQPDTWRWDGVVWSALPAAPFGNNLVVTEPVLGSVYAPLAGAVMTAAPATATAFGSSCAGSAGAPALRPFGLPWLGNVSFAVELTTPLPGTTVGLVAVGGQPASIVLAGGCTALLVPDATLLLLANEGFGTASIPVPSLPALLGAQLLAQGATLDVSAQLGFTLTAGIAIAIGG